MQLEYRYWEVLLEISSPTFLESSPFFKICQPQSFQSTAKGSQLPCASAPIKFAMHWALNDKRLKVLKAFESPKIIESKIN